MPRTDTHADLESALAIDENALNDALLHQSDLYYRVAKAHVLLVAQRDAAKVALQEAEARADLEIRRDAQVQEARVTEREVESQRRLHRNVISANEELLKLGERVGLAAALERAYDMRNKAIGKLSDLYVAGYFGGEARSHGAAEIRRASGDLARQRVIQAREGQVRRERRDND